MKQNELAKIIGIKPQYMNAIIKGRRTPSPGLAERLEMASGVDRSVWVWGTEMQKKDALRSTMRQEVAK